ncbi:MAG: T9SS type A sorting domain-containing protein [Candidatus Paceibacterota bacterium]|jgi:hypothetical protein
MKRIYFLLFFIVFFSSLVNAQIERDTVNGWYPYAVVGGDTSGVAMKTWIIKDDSIPVWRSWIDYGQLYPGELNTQTFFAKIPAHKKVRWIKKLGRSYVKANHSTPYFLSYFAVMDSLANTQPWGIMRFYLVHNDSLFPLVGWRSAQTDHNSVFGAGELGTSLENEGIFPPSFEAVVLEAEGFNPEAPTIMRGTFDNLRIIYGVEQNGRIDSLLTIDRFGDKEPKKGAVLTHTTNYLDPVPNSLTYKILINIFNMSNEPRIAYVRSLNPHFTPQYDSIVVNPGIITYYTTIFSPQLTSQNQLGRFLITYDDWKTPPDTFTIGGNVQGGRNGGDAAISTKSISFGSLHIHGMKTDTFTISNIGNLPLHAQFKSTDTHFKVMSEVISLNVFETRKISVLFVADSIPRAITGMILVSHDGLLSPDTIEVSANILTGVANDNSEIPRTFCMHQNYPNPFNPTTTIRYELPRTTHITLTVYDALGRSVEILVNGMMPQGIHEAHFDASHLPSGIYFCRIEADEYREIKKMLLIK